MEIIKTAICLKNRNFANALAKGLARENNRIQTYVKTKRGLEEEEWDIVLTDYQDVRLPRVVFLSSDKDANVEVENNSYEIYRYANSCEMTNAIFYIYFKMTGKVVSSKEKGNCKLITIFSINGGSGCTSIGISLGKMLYRLYKRRALYLSRRSVNTFDENITNNQSYLKLLYYLDRKEDFPIGNFINESIDVDYVSVCNFNGWARELNSSILQNLVKKLDGAGKYDFLILDIGDEIDTDALEMIRNSNAAIFVFKENDYSIVNKTLKEVINTSELGKLIKVCNFSDNEPVESEEEVFYVSLANSLNLNENFGIEISELAKNISEEVIG